MTDTQVVFEHRHPTDGALVFVADGELLRVTCRWPFDTENDEWIRIQTDLDRRSYAASVLEFKDTGSAKVDGLHGGFVEFLAVDSDTTQIEVANSVSDAPRLALRVPRGRSTLAPSLLAALEAASPQSTSSIRDDVADALLQEGIDLREAGNADAAVALGLRARRAISVRESIGLRAQIELLLGNSWCDLGRYDQADEALAQAATWFLQASLLLEYAQAMISRGRLLAERGQNRGAIRFFKDLEELSLPPVLKSQILNNLGLLYRHEGDMSEALTYLQRDVALCESEGDLHGAAVAHLNLAGTLAAADRREAARRHAEESARLFSEAGAPDHAKQANAYAVSDDLTS